MSREYFGKYRIEERLGSGTFATVYRCHDPDLDTTCAIKVLADNWSADESARNWFLNEARVMFGIEHPAILRIFTSGTLDDDRPYFVMEYADGGSLADLIHSRRRRNERFSPAEALEISVAIANGLNVAHSRHLVHRDLKPSNILFRTEHDNESIEGRVFYPDQQVKLADFGLARGLEQGTNSLAGAGTPHYIAPEQARAAADDLPDVRNDIYSAAAILYEMLAGQVPFPHTSMAQVIAAHLNEDPVPIQRLAPDVPDEVAVLVHAGLAKDPENRVSDASAWQRHLQILHAALNPDGSFSGLGGRAQIPVIPERQSVDTPLSNEILTVPAGLDVSSVAGDSVAEARADDGHEGSASTPDGATEGRRTNPMIPYVVASTFVGLLIVAILGFSIADLISETGESTTGNNGVVGEVADSDSVDDSDAAVDPTPPGEAAETDEEQPTSSAVETPEEEPTPTAEPEPTATPEADPSSDHIARALQELPGEASSAVVLPTGESIGDVDDRQVAAASTIKLWIAAAAYEEAEHGELDLDDEYIIDAEDLAFGTGVLNQGQYVGQSVSFTELIETMLVYSDNTAANILVEHAGGLERVNAYAEEHGYEDTQMQRMLGDVDTGEENYTSARDGALFMQRLIDGEVVDSEVSEELRTILGHRAATDDDHLHFFGRELPGDVEYAHISGLLPGVRNEVGYFYSADRDGYVVVSFMLEDLSDEGVAEAAISTTVGDINSHLATVAMQ